MDFSAFVASLHLDESTLTAEQRTALNAQWRASIKPTPAPSPTPVPVNDPNTPTAFDEKMAAIEAENARQEYIRAATTRAMEMNVGNREKCRQLRTLCDAAIADQKTDTRAFDLAIMRADRFVSGPLISVPAEQRVNEDVLEAAICVSHRLPNVEKKFSDQTLSAAQKRFKRGIGLQEMLAIAGERNNGYRGSVRDTAALCRAAFKVDHGADLYPRADVGPSTITVPGILSNVANKFLSGGFLFSEQSWRGIASIKSARDFKQMTSYRMLGNLKFEKVLPGGEIKHGTVTEDTYTNQVDTYGKMIGIDRRDIINDDLGAFTGLAAHFGRGAGDALNDVFWAEWVDDSAFFTTGNANYDDGAVDSLLTAAGLNNAETLFRLQTKPDGTPLGAMPAIILTPATLSNTALTLMGSQGLVVGTTPASGPDRNIYFGRYRVVSSVYLDAVPTIGTTAWYLLADPNNISGIEMAFLDGVDSPTVEQSEFDFDHLGLAMRAYFDFGCNKQEYRCGVKLKGAS